MNTRQSKESGRKATRKQARSNTRGAKELKSRRKRGSDAEASRRREDWEVKNPYAAGIDVGSREHWVSVGKQRAEARKFGAYTPQLDEMAQWLKTHGIKQVAMESTGMYWLPVYERLEQEGFEVILVDARQAKNTSGRKSDLLDCEWIQQLHTYGLLRAAFRPERPVCRLRTLQRHRKDLTEKSATEVQLMQKALDGMNLHIHHAISDLTGTSGQAILGAILKGVRDPKKLASLASARIHRSRRELEAALTGDYREEEIFVLGQNNEAYHNYLRQTEECDRQIIEALAEVEKLCAANKQKSQSPESARAGAADANSEVLRGAATKVFRRQGSREQQQSVVELLRRIFGVDLTAIPGLAALAVVTLLSEIGTDMSRWRSAKAFAAWMGLSPNHRITGGRIISRGSRKVKSRAATVLRIAAISARRTDTPLGAFFRRKAAQKGEPKAVTATARKMACLIYEMISTGKEYRTMDASAYQKRYDALRLKSLKKRAQELGFDLVQIGQAA